MSDKSNRQELLERYAGGADAVDAAVAGLSEEAIDHRSDPGDWNARQIVHHLADSESVAYVRLCRLIAEDEPLIEGYDEPEWARRLHYDRPIEPSLAVVRAVRTASHQLLSSLTETEWERVGRHSASGAYSVDRWLAIYAGHSHDHADQIRRAAAWGGSHEVDTAGH